MDGPLTLARLRERLNYDPSTGLFTRRTAPRNKSELLGKVAGGPVSHGYVTICIDGRHYPGNRLAWLYMTGEWPLHEVDHRNRRRADNRWDNLREATHQQNTFNQPLHRNNRSGVRGVAVDAQTGHWRAHITISGKMKCLGRFADKERAITARREAERTYFGEFAGV